MFTGLIQDLGTVERVAPGGTTDLWIRTALGAATFELGESVAVDGVCLTVVERGGLVFKVQAAPESLRRTTLGELRPGARVNLERALRMGDRLGGHLVQGHVDEVCKLVERRTEGASLLLSFTLPPPLAPCMVEKGSVTLDGVSLTLTHVTTDGFGVMLIPETQARTTLGRKAVGERVNVEGDIIGKYVARLYSLGAARAPGLTQGFIEAAGFGPRKE